jgi:hypothetical protein
MHKILITHPETAWLVTMVIPALTAAALIVAALLLRGRLAVLVGQLQARRAARRVRGEAGIDPALHWSPETVAPERVVTICLGVASVAAVTLTLAAPPALALLLGAPVTGLVAWGLLAAAERRYVARLEAELTGAVGRLSALLRANNGLRPALERVIAGLAEGPLRDEWAFLLVRQGAPLSQGGIATPQQVFTALAEQTASRRHAVLLNHLAAAAGQPQEVIARRAEAAYAALQASERRRDEAATELAQVRYSGIAVGLAGVTMALYLGWAQWERAAAAYSTPLGAAVGAVVLAALALPVAGAMLLSQVEDTDY